MLAAGEVVCCFADTMEAVTRAELEQRRDVVLARLSGVRTHGALSAELVHQAAVAAGVSPRTVYRWLSQGDRRPRGHRAGWVLPERAFELLVQWRGNVAAVRRELLAEGVEVPSLSTLRAAFGREVSGIERAYLVQGEEALRERAVYLRHEARFRGECYEGDHKQLSIEVLGPRGARPHRPWATIFIDQYSRLVVGWALSLQPTSAEVLAAIRMAVVDDPERVFGGVPTRLRWDRGREFGADAVTDAAGVLGCVSVRCQPYASWQKGKIERFNRTLEDELLRGLPRWTGGPRDLRGELAQEAALTLEYFSVLFADYIARYNERRPHDSLGGRVPLEVWRADSTPVDRIPAERARWMLKARATKVVEKDGIHHRKRIYYADALYGLRGEKVQIAFMPHDLRTIDIYTDDRFLATAVDQERLTDEDKRRALERRHADADAIRKRAAKARRSARVRVAPITTAGDVADHVRGRGGVGRVVSTWTVETRHEPHRGSTMPRASGWKRTRSQR